MSFHVVTVLKNVSKIFLFVDFFFVFVDIVVSIRLFISTKRLNNMLNVCFIYLSFHLEFLHK